MFVIKITRPANSKVSGTPSLLNILESVFQQIFLTLLESNAAFNMFKLKSSNDWDHSHQTPIRCLHLNNCKVYNITQLGTLHLLRFHIWVCVAQCVNNTISIQHSFNTVRIYQRLGSDTIIALTSPFLQAFVMLSNIGIFFSFVQLCQHLGSSFFCSDALSRSLFSSSKLILICFFVAPERIQCHQS